MDDDKSFGVTLECPRRRIFAVVRVHDMLTESLHLGPANMPDAAIFFPGDLRAADYHNVASKCYYKLRIPWADVATFSTRISGYRP